MVKIAKEKVKTLKCQRCFQRVRKARPKDYMIYSDEWTQVETVDEDEDGVLCRCRLCGHEFYDSSQTARRELKQRRKGCNARPADISPVTKQPVEQPAPEPGLHVVVRGTDVPARQMNTETKYVMRTHRIGRQIARHLDIPASAFGVLKGDNGATIKRGDIYYADLSPVIGSEQGGLRPVLIIQNDVGNHYSPTVIVAAMTTRGKPRQPTHVRVPKRESGLATDSVALLEQIRTIDKSRLLEKLGSVPDYIMNYINRALTVSVGDQVLWG